MRGAAFRASGRRGGETLVECLVAVALVVSVALPALAAVRGALYAAGRAASRVESSANARFRAISAAAVRRLGEGAEKQPNAATGPSAAGSGAAADLPPLSKRES